MLPPDLGRPPKESNAWDKWGMFSLALFCVLSMLGFGTWGRMRMLTDDNSNLNKQLQTEEALHQHIEAKLTQRLRHRRKLFGHLQKQLEAAVGQFKAVNETLRSVQVHAEATMQQARIPPSEDSISECKGVTLPAGFEYHPKGQAIFPNDLANDATALHELLKSSRSLASLSSLTTCLERYGLLSQSTSPWEQWTWLQALLERPQLLGNFTEWGSGAGGPSMFLGRLAHLRGGSLAGMDMMKSSGGANWMERLRNNAQECNFTVPQEAQFFDLSQPSIAWPEAGPRERLAFSHIASDDYSTTLGILNTVYPKTVDGGILAVDNFFHSSGASKRAVEKFFRLQTPGRSPLIFPVFPGRSVLIFKGRFASIAKGDRINELDHNFYSFDFIRGRPEIIAAVNQSAVRLSQAHQTARTDPGVNQTSLCWLSLALQKISHLQDLASTPNHVSSDFEATDIFQLMSLR